jgi:hypothetical protein
MITTLQQPGAISFSRNPMVYELQSNALYQSQGSKYVGLFSFSNYTDLLYSFQLIYGGLDLTFTVPIIGEADGSGYTLPSPAGKTEQQFMAGALAALQSNSYINRDFDLDPYNSNGIDYIRFTAKLPGANCQLSTDVNSHISLLQQAPGTDQVIQPNFKLLLEVWMQIPGSTKFERLSQAFPDVDDTGTCTYDISGIITDGLIAYGYDRPSLELPNFSYCSNTSRKYYLKVAEVYGTTQLIKAITQTAQKTAIYGGFSKRMREQLAFPGFFQADKLLRFLDQELAQKTTRLRQSEFLTFCALNGDLAQVNYQITINYTTGNAHTFTAYALNNVAQYSKIQFPAGYSQLNLGLYDDARTVISWSAVLVDAANNPISQARTFLLDYTYRPYGRYLLYLNSFGAYSSAFTYGKTSREYELTFQSAEITPKGGFRLIDGEKLDYDQHISEKISVVTGFITRRAIMLYRDVMLSTDKFILDKGRALPITILSSSIKEFKDGDNLYSLAFDFGFQWDEELYTYDPDEIEPYSAADLSNYTPANPETMPPNFDDRYYLKTLTYNRVEIDDKISVEAKTRGDADTVLQQEIDDLKNALANKADSNANYDDRYYTKAEINDMLALGDPIDLFFQAGTQNPITVHDFKTTYAGLGKYPTIMVLEKVSEELYKDYSDSAPQRNFIAGKLDNITVDIASAGGLTITDILIVLKR